MIAERIEANVLQASIPGEEASEWWWGICIFPPGYLPREESQGKRNTRQVQELTWVYVHAVREATCPVPPTPGVPPVESALT